MTWPARRTPRWHACWNCDRPASTATSTCRPTRPLRGSARSSAPSARPASTRCWAGVCPNCTGELVPRPARPRSLGDAAASTQRTCALPRRPAGPPDDARRTCHRAGPRRCALRRYATAWRAGDIDTVIDCYDPEFTLHYSGRSRFAGTHSGREAALAVMVEVSALAPRELVAVEQLLVGEGAGALVVTERLDTRRRHGRGAAHPAVPRRRRTPHRVLAPRARPGHRRPHVAMSTPTPADAPGPLAGIPRPCREPVALVTQTQLTL